VDELPIESRTYRNLRIEDTQMGDYPLIVVEAANLREGKYVRSHQRVIGGGTTRIAGHTMIYSDTYAGAPREPTYAYARHDVDQQKFFALLEEFVSTAILLEYPELRGKEAKCVVQTADELREVEYESYFTAIHTLQSISIKFARISFPFGDMTVEFKPETLIPGGELNLVARGMLTKQVESPLFAFDVSDSDLWVSLLTSIHWARHLVEADVLRSILRLAARAPVL
jgi:hypothetical protein